MLAASTSTIAYAQDESGNEPPPDGTEVIFLTESDCPTSDASACEGEDIPCLPKKARTNLRRIKLDTLLSEKTITQTDVLNVTGNPFGDVTDNRRVTGFDLSDDGSTIVFTATPSFTQNNSPIADGNARQRNDREVYRIKLDGSNMTQLSNIPITLDFGFPLNYDDEDERETVTFDIGRIF